MRPSAVGPPRRSCGTRRTAGKEDRNSEPGNPNPFKYTPDIALQPADLRAHWLRHIRGDQPKETEMKTTKLRLVRFGSAKALTRDGLGTVFEEAGIKNGLRPTEG